MTVPEFSSQISKISKTLRPHALRLTKNYDEAQDLLQDTLMKAYLNREKYADGTNLKAWFYTIMKNIFITNYQRSIRQGTFIDTTENLFFIQSVENSTNNSAISSFVMNDIERAIKKLENVYSEPFVMFSQGFKYQEISEELQIPIGTVKNRIHIARKELKDRLFVYQYDF